MENFKVSIPTPCQADWDSMPLKGSGRYCGACTQIVVDFSKMEPEEIKQYFLSNAGKATCGRFRNEQLIQADKRSERAAYWQNFYQKIQLKELNGFFNRASRFALLLLVGGLLTLSGCEGALGGKESAGEICVEPTSASDTTKFIKKSKKILCGKAKMTRHANIFLFN